MKRVRHNIVIACVCLAAALVGVFSLRVHSARAQGQAREVTVNGDHFAFSPARIEVQKDDLVKITFTAVDIPHSFTLDSYRISKRAGAGQTIVFEFRADQAGEHPFYCNLAQDDRCRGMKGVLIVR